MRGWRGLRVRCEWVACFFRIGWECSVGDDEVGSGLLITDLPIYSVVLTVEVWA